MLAEQRTWSDADLLALARAGDSEAFGALYERHAPAAHKMARRLTTRSRADDLVSESFARIIGAIQRGGGPTDTFAPYLAITLRNVNRDLAKRRRHDPPPSELTDINPDPRDDIASLVNGSAATEAFLALPARWQSVLWHLEVEGRQANEIAALLSISPNAVSAIAYRAREGLREAFVAAHLRHGTADECERVVASLAAYARNTVTARERTTIEAHLEHCTSCRDTAAEAADVNTILRSVFGPLAAGAAAAVAGSGWLTRLRPPKGPQAAAVAAGTVVAAAVASAAFAFGAAPHSAPQRAVPATVETTGRGAGAPDESAAGPVTSDILIVVPADQSTTSTEVAVLPATPGDSPVRGPAVDAATSDSSTASTEPDTTTSTTTTTEPATTSTTTTTTTTEPATTSTTTTTTGTTTTTDDTDVTTTSDPAADVTTTTEANSDNSDDDYCNRRDRPHPYC